MNIFAVVVTYNGLNWIDKCLSSLFDSSVDVSVILIDNKSTDGTLTYVKENYPQTTIVEPLVNLGFGKANNIGIKRSMELQADFVFLLNQDAWVEKSTIEDLIKIQSKNKDFGIVSPIHLNGRGSGIDFNFSQSCDAINCPDFLSDLYVNSLKEIYQINFVMAAIWLIPQNVLKKVGLFDPIFPHYGEDVDYVQRVIYHGYKIGICPSAIGYHDRENRPPSYKRSRVMRYLGYWCILKNNNNNLLISFCKFLILWSHNIGIFLGKLQIKYSLLEIWDGVKILFLIPKIIRNRKYCSGDSAFLSKYGKV